jgi:hypothetical protein
VLISRGIWFLAIVSMIVLGGKLFTRDGLFVVVTVATGAALATVILGAKLFRRYRR